MSVKVKEITAIFQASVAANLPANSIVPINIIIDPLAGPKTEHQVPLSQSWVLDDVYITSSQSPDGIIQFRKNRDTVVTSTAPVSTLLVSNPTRPTVTKKVWGPADILSAYFITLAAQGTSATTVTVYVKFKIFEASA